MLVHKKDAPKNIALESATVNDAVRKLPKGHNWGGVRIVARPDMKFYEYYDGSENPDTDANTPGHYEEVPGTMIASGSAHCIVCESDVIFRGKVWETSPRYDIGVANPITQSCEECIKHNDELSSKRFVIAKIK